MVRFLYDKCMLLPPELIEYIFFFLDSDYTTLYNYKVALCVIPSYKYVLHSKRVYGVLWSAQYDMLFRWLKCLKSSSLPSQDPSIIRNLAYMYHLYYRTLYHQLYHTGVKIRTILLRSQMIVQMYMINGNCIKDYLVPYFRLYSNGHCSVRLEFRLLTMMPLFKYFSERKRINYMELDNFFYRCDKIFEFVDIT